MLERVPWGDTDLRKERPTAVINQTLPRLLSGIQPTGKMHLGNYLGAIQNWVSLQSRFDSYFMIVDLHALTSVYENPAQLRIDKQNLALDLLGAGIDPEKACLFYQSDVPEHSELHLILSMITPLPWLTRVPSYKSKIEEIKDKDLDTYGFLGYPVLQAADILLYKATSVPVGKDQLPHLELSREIARRFNHFYGPIFPEPEAALTEFAILPGLDGRKMSKSYQNTLPISESPETLQKLIMTMLTDPARVKRTDPGHPDICPVFAYHKIFNTPERTVEIHTECQQALIGCVSCKKECAGLVIDSLAKFRKNRRTFENDLTGVEKILQKGAEKARKTASVTIKEVKKAVGL